MTIEFKTGNILNAETQFICHQVNYQGKMSAGLAKQIKDKWPEIFESYLLFIKNNSWEVISETGSYDKCLTQDKSKVVLSIFGQKYYGRDKDYTIYDILEKSFKRIKNDIRVFNHVQNKDFSLGIPYKFGSGLSGGDWNIVYKIIQDIFENSEVKVVIYKLEGVE